MLLTQTLKMWGRSTQGCYITSGQRQTPIRLAAALPLLRTHITIKLFTSMRKISTIHHTPYSYTYHLHIQSSFRLMYVWQHVCTGSTWRGLTGVFVTVAFKKRHAPSRKYKSWSVSDHSKCWITRQQFVCILKKWLWQNVCVCVFMSHTYRL